MVHEVPGMHRATFADRLPKDVFLHTLSFLEPLELASSTRVCKYFQSATSVEHVWWPHLDRAKHLEDWGKLLGEEEWRELRADCGENPKALFAAMFEHAHNARVMQWRTSAGLASRHVHSDLSAVRVFRFRRGGGELRDVQFITRRHKWGYVSYLLPLLTPFCSYRTMVLGTAAACALRYLTYDVYYDSGKRLKKGRYHRWRAVYACLRWAVWSHVLLLLLQYLFKRVLQSWAEHRASTVVTEQQQQQPRQQQQQVRRSSDDDYDWDYDGDDNSSLLGLLGTTLGWVAERGGMTFQYVDSLPLPSVWR